MSLLSEANHGLQYALADPSGFYARHPLRPLGRLPSQPITTRQHLCRNMSVNTIRKLLVDVLYYKYLFRRKMSMPEALGFELTGS